MGGWVHRDPHVMMQHLAVGSPVIIHSASQSINYQVIRNSILINLFIWTNIILGSICLPQWFARNDFHT